MVLLVYFYFFGKQVSVVLGLLQSCYPLYLATLGARSYQVYLGWVWWFLVWRLSFWRIGAGTGNAFAPIDLPAFARRGAHLLF